MSRGGLLAAAVGGTALVVLLMAVFLGWWALLWIPLTLLVVGIAAAFVIAPQRRPGVDAEPAAARANPVADGESPPRRRKHVARVPLPSAHPDYHFLFSAYVCWRGRDALSSGTDGMATSAVTDRAAELTRVEPPEDCDTVQYRVSAELGQPMSADEHAVELWAEDVRVELRDDDAHRLRRIRDLRKDEEIRGLERKVERSERSYLGKEVLADPGEAVVWWLARDSARIEETVERIGTLSRLSAAASGSEIPQLYRDLMGEIALPGNRGEWPGFVGPHTDAAEADVDGGFTEPSDAPDPLALYHAVVEENSSDEYVKQMNAERLAQIMEQAGNHELAERLREEYLTVQAEEEPDDCAPPAAGETKPATSGDQPAPDGEASRGDAT